MPWRTENFEDVVRLIRRLPVGQHFDVDSDGAKIGFQAHDQKAVREVFAAFPGAIWKKTYHADLAWWDYDCKYEGFRLHIYACAEAPPTCRAIIEDYQVEELVPIGRVNVEYEKKMVTKQRIRYECGPDEQS